MAVGMGMTTAPSTGAIMRSLPLHKAGVGSAVNDTTRELGGALGVAVLGSLVASHFRSHLEGTLGGLPAGASRSLADTLAFASQAGARAASSPTPRGGLCQRVRLHVVDLLRRRGGGSRCCGVAPTAGRGRAVVRDVVLERDEEDASEAA